MVLAPGASPTADIGVLVRILDIFCVSFETPALTGGINAKQIREHSA